MRYVIFFYQTGLFSSGLDDTAHADTEAAAIAAARKKLKDSRRGSATVEDKENGHALVASVVWDRGTVRAKRRKA